MKQTSEEFVNAMLQEDPNESSGDASLADKMAELEENIQKRIDEVEKNILNNVSRETLEETEETEENENNEKEGE